MGDVGRAMFTPRQTQQKYIQTDPFRNLKPQQAMTEDLIFGRAQQGAPGVGNPYVGPRPEQSQALAALQGYQKGAEPLYRTGVETLEKTAAGGYLDPMQSDPFRRLSDARLATARQLFGEFAPQYSSAAGARGVPYGSSAQLAGVQRGAERIGTQAAQDIAQAGWGQYGAERGLQQQAAGLGTQLAPGLAGQVFGAGEQLRSAQQQANQAQMAARLQAAGIDNATIGNVLRYMALAAGQPLTHIVGKSPYEEWSGVVNDVGQIAGNAYTGGVGGALKGMCWIAAALYGDDSAAFHCARYWIVTAWTGPVAAVTRLVYRTVGRPVAWWARRSPRLRAWLRPWFDQAVVRGAIAAGWVGGRDG